MDKKTKIKFHVLAIFVIIIFSFALTPKTLQNDTYYTIAIGEHILENGIDIHDPFSWHEDLPYTYPHWAYDVATYLVYQLRRKYWNWWIYSNLYCYSNTCNSTWNCNLLCTK